MKTVSLYDPATGLLTGEQRSAPTLEHLLSCVPAGLAAIEGEIDHCSYRVEIGTRKVIDWQPPLPDDDHVWDPGTRRNTLKPEVAERRAKQVAAQAQMDALELKSLRSLRELKLNDKNEAARRRLQAIEGEITRLSIESGLSTPESRSDQIDQTEV